MKCVLLISASITLCASSYVPIIIGDNSNYVEGKSRYIWMPDGDGVPFLLDLRAPITETMQRNGGGADNQYWLYTRSNPLIPQFLHLGDFSSLIRSNYDPEKPIKVIVHGWRSNGLSIMNPMITEAFLSMMDCNVIVVDWSSAASSFTYILSTNQVPSVGEYLGDFLNWVVDSTDANWDNVHLVGFSLGAHVVGTAGRRTNSRVGRITGLDPAGPIWGGNTNCLSSGDAQHVEAIHTDGGALGMFDPIADANFYPNGGRNAQPGCWVSTCSHSRSYHLFASSVLNTHLIGYRCPTLEDAKNAECFGDSLAMGSANNTKQGSGIFSLVTDKDWPY